MQRGDTEPVAHTPEPKPPQNPAPLPGTVLLGPQAAPGHSQKPYVPCDSFNRYDAYVTPVRVDYCTASIIHSRAPCFARPSADHGRVYGRVGQRVILVIAT